MAQLDFIQNRLGDDLAKMNNIIAQFLATPNNLMNEVVTNYLKIKGKQIRPILVLLSAKMLGNVNNDVLHAAAALEMLHNASLIHDDIVDETNVRRGVPTVNAVWGNHIAVLVGDFFVSNALAAGIKTGHLSIIAALSDLGKELSIGEVDQICNARGHAFSEDAYISMIRKKTASLFMNCVRMGAQAAGAPHNLIEPLVRYAELLGLCFQIKDDIFDYYDSGEIGKPTGNDLREDKVTLPLLYALRTAPQDVAESYKEMLRNGNLSDTQIAELIEFAKQYGGIEYAFARMREMQEEAESILAEFPDSQWKDAFNEIFAFIISRNK